MLPIRDNIPASRRPLAMFVLMLLNILVFWFQFRMPAAGMEAMIESFGMVPARDFSDAYEQPFLVQTFPFVSSLFLHGSFMHLLSNMWSLWLFGDNVEDRMGSARFLVFYLLCGLIAGLTHAYLYAGSWIPAVGASGAISGVMGAYLVLFPHSRLTMVTLLLIFPFVFEIPAVLFLILWFIGQLFGGTYALGESVSATPNAAAGIAFWAHIGGFIAGLALLPFFTRKPRGKPEAEAEAVAESVTV